MVSPINAEQQPIEKIFSKEYVFSIPTYQRPYSWTTEQTTDLFDDLYAAMQGAVPVANLSPYFLGSMVLIKEEDKAPADVVDGQQRLTTLVLLLSAIRHLSEARYATEISKLLFESGSELTGRKDEFRLTLRDKDADFFRKHVQEEDGFGKLVKLAPGGHSDPQANLIRNGKLFLEKLEKISKEERVRLVQFILLRCYLVAVSTPDLDSAYRIFSVLNSRGLDLSATDILKAEIIGAVAQGGRDDYTAKWEDIEEELSREKFGELFSHIRMVYRKAKPQGTLLKEFKDHVTANSTPERLIDDIIVPMADVYDFLTHSNFASPEGAEAVNLPLKWLNRLEFVDWLPPALAFAVRHKGDAKSMASFLSDLERLSYGMLLGKWGINDRMERFAKVTAAVEAGDDLAADTSPLQLTPKEQLQVYEALAGPFYDTFAARARTTVLLRLDALLSGGGATYDYPVITVEHVLPQNPDAKSGWAKWMPDPMERATHVHLLGNMALLTRKKNSAASNYDFERKKTAYFQAKDEVSPFVLTTQVLGKSQWTKAEISERQMKLLEKLESHWRLRKRNEALAAAAI